ncbi:unnamed protein product, partial [marine sediment metagenome]
LRSDWSLGVPSVVCSGKGAQALSDESKKARKTSLLPYYPVVEEGNTQRFALLTGGCNLSLSLSLCVCVCMRRAKCDVLYIVFSAPV